MFININEKILLCILQTEFTIQMFRHSEEHTNIKSFGAMKLASAQPQKEQSLTNHINIKSKRLPQIEIFETNKNTICRKNPVLTKNFRNVS